MIKILLFFTMMLLVVAKTQCECELVDHRTLIPSQHGAIE